MECNLSERTILHIDANSFYASVECAENPELADKPVAVAGDAEKRHGIILTANYIAKHSGIRTGETIWQAKQKCPELVIVTARMDLYMEYSRRMREILYEYSDYVEPFGCDESWIELKGLFKNAGYEVAETIRRRIKRELNITVSIGVSFNKVFAKLGSDMKKPDAVTVISKENYKQTVWTQPVENLLYVGRKTKILLNKRAVYTIGDLATSDETQVSAWLGKNGIMLREFARGMDTSEVSEYDNNREYKSISNSTTCPRDLKDDVEVKTVLAIIAESVAERLRKHGVKGNKISLYVRDTKLHTLTHAAVLDFASDNSYEIAQYAMKLFKECYGWVNPVRSIGISIGGFETEYSQQLDILGETEHRIKREAIDRVGDYLKNRFGKRVIRKAVILNAGDLRDIHLSDNHPMALMDNSGMKKIG